MRTRPFELLIAAWTQVLVFLGLILGLFLVRSGLGTSGPEALDGLSGPGASGGLLSGLLGLLSSPQVQTLVLLGLGALMLITIPLFLKASRALLLCCPMGLLFFLGLTLHFFSAQGLAPIISSDSPLLSSGSAFSQLWWGGLMAIWVVGTAPALLSPRCHLLFLNPNMRWWLSAERKTIKNKVVLNTPGGHSLLTATQDLSSTGAFVPMGPSQFERLGLSLGDRLEFKLWAKDNYKDPLNLSAQVVRYGVGPIWSVQGLGLHFIEADPHTQNEVDRLVAEAPDY